MYKIEIQSIELALHCGWRLTGSTQFWQSLYTGIGFGFGFYPNVTQQ